MKLSDRISWATKNAKSPKSIFIIPTSIGLSLIAISLFCLIAGMIYNNNLVLILGLLNFILIGFSSIITNFHLEEYQNLIINLTSSFVNEKMILKVHNLNKIGSETIKFKVFLKNQFDNKTKSFTFRAKKNQTSNHLEFEADETLGRGSYQIIFVELFTLYPFGLFKSWKINKNQDIFYRYPARTFETTLSIEKSSEQETQRIFSGIDEYGGHQRASHQQIGNRTDWKRFFLNQEVWNKQFHSNLIYQFHFDLTSLSVSNEELEIQLSQICNDLHIISELNNEWSITTRSTKIHNELERSLEELAMWEL